MSTYVSAPATLVKATANGKTSAGALSIPGLQVGDVLIKVIPDGFYDGYENVVSTADQIQQLTDLDWSSLNLEFILLRGV